MWPIPSEQELKALYSRNENPFYENGLSLELEALLHDDRAKWLHYFADRIGMLERLVPDFRSQRILDFGCTSGLFVQALKYAGAQRAEGVDIIAELIAHGRSKGLALTLDTDGTFLTKQPSAFDVICANNVVEHLSDPGRVLGDLAGALRSGGHLGIGVPNVASLQVKVAREKSPVIDPPHHVHYFTPRSLRNFVERIGLQVLSVGTVFWGRETDIYLASKGMSNRTASALRALMTPVKFGVEWADLGGIIQLVARRP
jgi:2-polyprenyl-3-methyl-5-hydroxy-6-metoxy-1,4-benzoquinol methylase